MSNTKTLLRGREIVYFRSNYHEVRTEHQPPFDYSVCIPLSRGHHALIDADDYYKLGERLAWTSDEKRTVYAKCQGIKHGIPLHRFIINAPQGVWVDHANMNGLDNRKANLRLCDRGLNQVNSAKRGTKSKYRGVYFSCGKYYARLMRHKKSYNLGCFPTEEEAAKAYDNGALEHFGEFARLNFPALAAHGGSDGK